MGLSNQHTAKKMASIINALDNFTSMRMGENGHAELDWSNGIEERIAQFDFQCVRTDSPGIASLASILDGLLSKLSVRRSDPEGEAKRVDLLIMLYKIIGATRDINGGKGEYALAYMMIWTWYTYFPDLAKRALDLFVLDPKDLDLVENSREPYGSWKDIKYFCKYVLDETGDHNHELIQYCIHAINKTLRADDLAYGSTDNAAKLTLAAKWVPREESGKFGFLYEALATHYFPEYMASAKTEESKTKAIKKCKAQYRMMCSRLNRHLDTVQIKQTGGAWASIDHAKTTSITMAKQRRAFLNLKKGQQRSYSEDRIACAENLRAYMEDLKKDGKELKGKQVGLDTFAAHALAICRHGDSDEKDILNSQWRDNGNQKNADGLGPMIAVVDTSGSMDGDPLNAAIALGCRVAEKSIFGKRLMTFSSNPTWVNLDGCNTFTDMVRTIHSDPRFSGLNTDFYKALDLILTVIEEKRIPPADAENMILALFSDMQIDDNLSCMNGGSYSPSDKEKTEARRAWASLYNQIKQKYADVGMRLYGVPLNPPHILFWNLRKTEGFPALSTEAGCSMMSGYDPTVLNLFCEKGIAALKEMSPYKMLTEKLANDRYTPMETILRRHFDGN
jgi:hypothetical protein